MVLSALVFGSYALVQLNQLFFQSNGAGGPGWAIGQPQTQWNVRLGNQELPELRVLALGAPRWQFLAGQKVALEQSVPQALGLELSDRGHSMQIGLESRHFGKGQLILRHQGVLIAASNPRAGDLAIVH